MKILKRWAWAESLQRTYNQPTTQRIKALWREGWIQYPSVMASCCVGGVAFILGFYVLYHSYHRPTEKYLLDYTVMRPGDPRIQRINHYSRLD